MSSSDPDSKVDLLDDTETVKAKLKKAFCEEGNVEDNPILQFLRAVVFPIKSLTDPTWTFSITRPEKHGGDVHFTTYDALHEAFLAKSVHPGDLKTGAALALDALLEPIRQIWRNDASLQRLSLEAYPPPAPKLVSDLSMVELRIGRVVAVERHSERENLFIEQIDVGEATGARTIVSGLAPYMSPADLLHKLVVVVTNLKPSKFAGVVSSGMVLACTEAATNTVQILEPVDEGCGVGEYITIEGFESAAPNPAILNPKQKVWERVSVDMAVEECIAKFKGVDFKTSTTGCQVRVKSISKGTIS